MSFQAFVPVVALSAFPAETVEHLMEEEKCVILECGAALAGGTSVAIVVGEDHIPRLICGTEECVKMAVKSGLRLQHNSHVSVLAEILGLFDKVDVDELAPNERRKRRRRSHPPKTPGRNGHQKIDKHIRMVSR